MKSANNAKVDDFLRDIQSLSPDIFKIFELIRDIFRRFKPNIVEDIKYGGVVYSIDGNLVGGIYPYKAHISIEFSNGALLPDPDDILEGKGKKRRHIKIVTQQDIVDKNVKHFIEAVVSA